MSKGLFHSETIEARRLSAIEALKRATAALEDTDHSAGGAALVSPGDAFGPAYEDLRVANEAIGLYISPDRRLR